MRARPSTESLKQPPPPSQDQNQNPPSPTSTTTPLKTTQSPRPKPSTTKQPYHPQKHSRRPSLGSTAALEIIQSQALDKAQGGKSDPITLVNALSQHKETIKTNGLTDTTNIGAEKGRMNGNVKGNANANLNANANGAIAGKGNGTAGDGQVDGAEHGYAEVNLNLAQVQDQAQAQSMEEFQAAQAHAAAQAALYAAQAQAQAQAQYHAQLQAHAAQLQAQGYGSMQTLSPSTTNDPSSPNPNENILLGALNGLNLSSPIMASHAGYMFTPQSAGLGVQGGLQGLGVTSSRPAARNSLSGLAGLAARRPRMSSEGGYSGGVAAGMTSPQGAMSGDSSTHSYFASPIMDPNSMTGNYGPAAAAAAAAAAGNATGRTVYVGNLPADAAVDELLNLVRFGPIESVRLLPEKSCVFISFLDGATAAAFHADATVKKLTLRGQELKIGWGKPSPVPNPIIQGIALAKATRNVFIGGLHPDLTEAALRDDMNRFGPIDQVKIVRDKSIGFIHFLSIAAAMKVVQTLPSETAWYGRRIGYGKDRCAYVPRAQQAAVIAAQQQAAAALGHTLGMPGASFQALNPLSPATLYTSQFQSPVFRPQSNFEEQDPENTMQTNRCIYIGQIPEDAETADICDAIRGGMIAQMRYVKEGHYAFVTFADPVSAAVYYEQAVTKGILIKGGKVRISWGRSVSHISAGVTSQINGGATRNVYIGNIKNIKLFNREKLKNDFAEFGEIEQINYLAEKKAAFINFCAVGNATRAIDRIKLNPDYNGCRISFGKDRCASLPKHNHFGNNPRATSIRGEMSPGSGSAPMSRSVSGNSASAGVSIGAANGNSNSKIHNNKQEVVEG